MNKLIDLRQLRALITAHSLELLREPAVLFWGILFPILMSLGLGSAFSKKADKLINIAVTEPETKNGYEELLTAKNHRINLFLQNLFTGTGHNFKGIEETEGKLKLTSLNKKSGNNTFTFQSADWKQATRLLKRGEICLILELKNQKLLYHFEPVNPEAQYAYQKLQRLSEKKSLSETEENLTPLTLPGTRYIDFLIPGLIAMGIMMSCLWGLSYGIIEKRSRKLLRRMVATPMKKSYFLLSLIAVRAAMNVFEASILYLFAYFAFGVVIQGSLLALLLVFLSSNLAFSGISILAASRTSNNEVGNGLINAISTPMIVISGVFFSYHNFPDWTVSVIKFLPMTLVTDALRSVFIEGAGLKEVANPVIILTSTGICLFAAGLKLFKWH